MRHSKHITPAAAEAVHATIGVIQDFPKPGIVFRDVSPMLRNGEAFTKVIDALCAPYAKRMPTHIVGIESRGFIFGAAMAHLMGVGFVSVRKAGKLPGRVDRISYDLEYGNAALDLQIGTFQQDDKVAIVDDLLATGGTAEAAANLVLRQGATVVSYDFVIELVGLGGAQRLSSRPDQPRVHALFSYE